MIPSYCFPKAQLDGVQDITNNINNFTANYNVSNDISGLIEILQGINTNISTLFTNINTVNNVLFDAVGRLATHLLNPEAVEIFAPLITYAITQEINISQIADHDYNGTTITDATVDTNAFGLFAALYQAADTHFDTARADSTTTTPCMALATETGTGTKIIMLQGIVRDDSWTWACGPVYLDHATAGNLTQSPDTTTSGHIVQIVGWALASNVLYFNPMYPMVEIL